MQCERIYYENKESVYLDCYILNNGLKLGQSMARPAVVICPGGGYVYLSPREAEPVALAYAAKGIHAFSGKRYFRRRSGKLAEPE